MGMCPQDDIVRIMSVQNPTFVINLGIIKIWYYNGYYIGFGCHVRRYEVKCCKWHHTWLRRTTIKAKVINAN